MENNFRYGIGKLTIENTLQLARGEIKGIIVNEVRKKIIKCYKAVQSIVKGDKLVYSINTGFGSLCTTRISVEETEKLQENLLKSHSVGVGSPIDVEISKIMLILKLHALCQGFSGVSEELVERINWHIDNNYIPLVPKQGSVGASGDLAYRSNCY
jgi:histidine ammonia-lyase